MLDIEKEMTDSFPNLFKAIANTTDEHTLNQEVVPQVGKYFAAKHCKLFLLDRLPRRVSKLF